MELYKLIAAKITDVEVSNDAYPTVMTITATSCTGDCVTVSLNAVNLSNSYYHYDGPSNAFWFEFEQTPQSLIGCFISDVYLTCDNEPIHASDFETVYGDITIAFFSNENTQDGSEDGDLDCATEIFRFVYHRPAYDD